MKRTCRYATILAALGLLALMALQQAAVGGLGPVAPEVLVTHGGALAGWHDAPKAFATHAGGVHLATNLVLAALFAGLWVRLGARVPCRGLGAVGLFVFAGALALLLAQSLTPAARVGASGGVHALLGALVPAIVARREAFADPRSRRIAIAGTVGGVALLLVVGASQVGPVDHAAHGIGAGLGVVGGVALERWPRAAAVATAGAAFIWAALALV